MGFSGWSPPLLGFPITSLLFLPTTYKFPLGSMQSPSDAFLWGLWSLNPTPDQFYLLRVSRQHGCSMPAPAFALRRIHYPGHNTTASQWQGKISWCYSSLVLFSSGEKKKSKQTKSTQKGKENTLKCRVDLLKIFWILQMKSCRCLHWVRQPDLEAFRNYVCGRADLLLPGEEFDLELPWEPWYCHGTGQLCWSLHKHLE